MKTKNGLLRTRRLILRPPRRSDVAALATALDNPRVAMGLVQRSLSLPAQRRRSAGSSGSGRAGRHGGDLYGGFVAPGDAWSAPASHSRSDAWPDGFELQLLDRRAVLGPAAMAPRSPMRSSTTPFGRAAPSGYGARSASTVPPARRVVEKCGFQFRDTGMVRSIAARGAVPVERFVLERRVWASLKSWGAERSVRGDAERGGGKR